MVKKEMVMVWRLKDSLVPRPFFATWENWSGERPIPFLFPVVAKIVT